MDRYIGTKIILAEPMEKAQFGLSVRPLEGIIEIDEYGKSQPGYRVIYEDGYESWSPKETFERAYRLITDTEVRLLVYNRS